LPRGNACRFREAHALRARAPSLEKEPKYRRNSKANDSADGAARCWGIIRLQPRGIAVGVVYEIGPFRLDPVACMLWYEGNPVALGARGVAVLSALVGRANQVVTKDGIMDAAWPGLVVEESNLSVQITAIRRALNQAPGGERWVETLARRGYRFVGPVTVLADGGPQETSGSVVNSNLPAPITSFVGRERELVEVKRLLSGTRMLTLTGVGGIGKTRLALQAAAEVMDAYRDGVFFVDLTPLVDATSVPGAVLQALGLQESAGTPLRKTLDDHLKGRQVLLLLDNCEHLLEACASLAAALLREAPDLSVLATSREPLHIAGEQTYLLPTLSLPDPVSGEAAIGRSEAVQLFVARAVKQQPGFVLTAARAAVVAQLCVHLDGIPLALELAAARIRSLSVEEINARLGDRFTLLTRGERTALPRQQTLRALIDWSHDLLLEAERALLCRLSLFAGGWTLAAAEQVCSGEGVAEAQVLDLITSLADKSMVLAEERGGVTRYRLLETVRQYARDRLREKGEEARSQERHLAYFLRVVEEAEPKLTGVDQQVLLDLLETENDNLRSALASSLFEGGKAVGGLRMTGALWRFWLVRGHVGEGRSWLAALLAAASDTQPAAARAKALNGAGVLAWQQGDFPAARAHHEDSLAIRRKSGDRKEIADSLANLGLLAHLQGQYPDARVLYEESLAIRRELDDRRGIAGSLNNLGLVADSQGDIAAAKALHEESLAIRRALGNRSGIADSLNNLGETANARGDHSAARALHDESLAIRRELADRTGVAMSLRGLGLVAADEGDYPAARVLHEESLSIKRELGDRRGIAESLEGLADVAAVLDVAGRAPRLWGGAERLREEIGCPMLPQDRARYERHVAAARTASDDDTAFDEAWQEGRAMTMEQAIEFALEAQAIIGRDSTAEASPP
jgi:predicted ATPase/DNA-binding winged helix-turn-helix (wHTH) protein